MNRSTAIIMVAMISIVAVVALGTGRLPGSEEPKTRGMKIASGDFGTGHDVMHKFGEVVGLGTTQQVVWACGQLTGVDTLYPWVTVSNPVTLYISSDDAADTQTIEVSGLDANWERQTQVVTLAGLTFTEIGSGLTWRRVYRAKNTDSAQEDLEGNVYIHDDDVDVNADGIPDASTDTVACIVAGADNQTLQTPYTIPADFRAGYLTHVCIGVNRNAAAVVDFALQVRENDTPMPFQTKFKFSNERSAGPGCKSYEPPVYIPAKADIQVLATSTAPNTTAYATFTIELE